MEKIIITIILVNIEITIIQTIIFEFENMMYLFSMSLPKNTENLEISLMRIKNKYKKLYISFVTVWRYNQNRDKNWIKFPALFLTEEAVKSTISWSCERRSCSRIKRRRGKMVQSKRETFFINRIKNKWSAKYRCWRFCTWKLLIAF